MEAEAYPVCTSFLHMPPRYPCRTSTLPPCLTLPCHFAPFHDVSHSGVPCHIAPVLHPTMPWLTLPRSFAPYHGAYECACEFKGGVLPPSEGTLVACASRLCKPKRVDACVLEGINRRACVRACVWGCVRCMPKFVQMCAQICDLCNDDLCAVCKIFLQLCCSNQHVTAPTNM